MNEKVLLVTSPAVGKNNFWTCSITSPVGSLMPPCDLASIAAVLRRDGAEPRILDIRLADDPMEALEREVRAWRPNGIVTNLGTASAVEDYRILDATRDTVPRRICFCFHAMAVPDEVFQRGATHVLAGDPEYAVTAAVRGLPSDRGLWTPGDTRAAPGWIRELDGLPFPALDLLDLDRYHSMIMGKERFSILLAARGCPNQCVYCVIPYLFGHRVRNTSPVRIVDQIERDARDFGIRSFFFIDSAVNLDPVWLAETCEEILRRGLRIRWCGNMRPSPVEPDLLDLMRRSGCFRLFYGVEDLDHAEELRRRTTREATQRAFELTRAAGIETVAFLMVFPGFDRSEIGLAMRLVDMAVSLGTDALQCNVAIPYPGSRMFAEMSSEGRLAFDWALYDPAGSGVPYESGMDLVRVRTLVYLLFFLRNPRYVWRTMQETSLRSVVAFARNAFHVLWA